MSTGPQIALIAAVARNGAIGLNNGLIWQEPADQKHFRTMTMGCPVLMGRKTWQSLQARFRPLPGRRNVVLSRDAALTLDGAEVAGSLPQALQRLHGASRAFVIGGAQLYALALPLAQELVLTEIDADLPGDTFFPPWDRSLFDADAAPPAVSIGGVAYRFVTYRRR